MFYPEMVKRNARYRGPRESYKQNASVKDIQASVALLTAHMNANKEKKRSLFADIDQSFYDQRGPTIRDTRIAISSAKGGEI